MDKKNVRLDVRIDDNLNKELMRIARKQKLTRSGVTRKAIELFIKEFNKTK